jgi:hypothetical protein
MDMAYSSEALNKLGATSLTQGRVRKKSVGQRDGNLRRDLCH